MTVGERPTRVVVTMVGLLVAGAAGFIEKDLAAGTLTIALAVWALLALFGLGQLFGAVRRSLRPRPGSRSRSVRARPAAPLAAPPPGRQPGRGPRR